jgi:hypothetical protein
MKLLILISITFSSLSFADNYNDYLKYRDQENTHTESINTLSPQDQMLDKFYESKVPVVKHRVITEDFQLPIEDIENKKVSLSCTCLGVNERSHEKISMRLSDESEDELTALTHIENQCELWFNQVNSRRGGDFIFELTSEVEIVNCK